MASFKNDRDLNDKQVSWFKRHKILTVLLALLLIGIVSSALGGDKTNTASNSNQTSNQEQKPEEKDELAKVGTAVRDGKFEFVVKSVECGQASVGTNQYLTKTAQGQYCLLSVSVKNIGDKAQSLFSGNQKLTNATGQEYSADDTATMYAAPQGSTWYSEINPGNTVEGSIVFDIPKDQTPTVAVLHDSMASRGVKVSLQ